MSDQDRQLEPETPAPHEGPVSRRQFVTTVAGATAAAMIVPRHVLGRGFQAPSDTVNIATVGINGMGSSNTTQVMTQNIVAICDCDFGLLDNKLKEWTDRANTGPPPARAAAKAAPDARAGAAAAASATDLSELGPSKAQQAANTKWTPETGNVGVKRFVDQQLPKLKKYSDYREMIDKQKDIDGVIIATPDHMHAIIASAAMDAGKHVYVQKPMCWSVHEARHLAKKALEKKVVTQMGNQGHSQDDARRGQEYLMAGAIGDVTEVHVWTNRPLGYWPQGVPRPARPPIGRRSGGTTTASPAGWPRR